MEKNLEIEYKMLLSEALFCLLYTSDAADEL